MLYEILLLHGLPGESYHPSIILRRSHNMRGQIARECTLLICAILSGGYGQILLDARCTEYYLAEYAFRFGASTPNQGIEGTLHEIHCTAYQAMALEATSRSQDPKITDESLLPPMSSPTIGLPKHRVLRVLRSLDTFTASCLVEHCASPTTKGIITGVHVTPSHTSKLLKPATRETPFTVHGTLAPRYCTLGAQALYGAK